MRVQKDKQKAYIRSPISSAITWETERTDIVSVLCAISTKDFINLSNLEWVHPTEKYIVAFDLYFLVMDNKAINSCTRKQGGGNIRGKGLGCHISANQECLNTVNRTL